MVVEIRQEVCSGHLLKWLVAAGLAWLEHNVQQVNDMNVFPVPDGDTGTNMLHTMERAYSEIAQSDEDHVGVVSGNVAHGALYGARGNSGTILSQLLAGFGASLKEYEVFNARQLSEALEKAVALSYKAVTNPKEGTILTVAREMSEAVSKAAVHENDLYALLELMVAEARASLERTPDLLPILKESGVVDSGGLGLVFILEGMLKFLNGETVSYRAGMAEVPEVTNGKSWQSALIPEDDEGYGYDVQFLMRGRGMNVDAIRDAIDAMGWSTLVVGDTSLIKVHVHVHNPGEPLTYAITLGAELDDIVVENMQLQYKQYVEERIARETNEGKEIEGIAVIAVANGEGLAKVFEDLEAARVISGGQTMNPSTEDFLTAIDSLPNHEVILLPNNSNIILTAKQAAALCRDKTVRVLSTRTVPQGISAMIAYGDARQDGDLESVTEAMQEAMRDVYTCEITRAIRDAEFDGVKVRSGQIIGLLDDRLVVAGEDLNSVVNQVLHKAHAEDRELASIYYGAEADLEMAQDLVRFLRKDFSRLEFEIVNGGQPLYPYLISIE